MTLVRALTVTLEYLEVTPITRRQLDDLWEVKTARTAGDFAEAATRIAFDTQYPVDVVYGLLGGAPPPKRGDRSEICRVPHSRLRPA
jgi:hypothetical protein